MRRCVKHEVLPGELTTFRAVGAPASAWAPRRRRAVADASPRRSAPSSSRRSPRCCAWPGAGDGVRAVGAAARAGSSRAAHRRRGHRGAIQNMDGGREVYDGFYLYVALSAVLLPARRPARIVIAVIAVAAAVPLAGDASASRSCAGPTWPRARRRWRWCCARRASRRATTPPRCASSRCVDQLTGVAEPPRLRGARRTRRCRGRGAMTATARARSTSTSTASSRSTTTSATRPATACSGAPRLRWRGAARRGRARARRRRRVRRAAPGLVSTEIAASVARPPTRRAVASRCRPGPSHVSATTAWSTYPHDGETLDELMRAADAACSSASARASRPARWVPGG